MQIFLDIAQLQRVGDLFYYASISFGSASVQVMSQFCTLAFYVLRDADFGQNSLSGFYYCTLAESLDNVK